MKLKTTLFVGIFLLLSTTISYAQTQAQPSPLLPPSTPLASITLTPTPDEITRITNLESQITNLSEKVEHPPKDLLDVLAVLSPLITSGIIAFIIWFVGHRYTREQDRKNQNIAEIQIVLGCMPQLQSGDERAVEAALLVINKLGKDDIAIGLAQLFGSPGANQALSKIALSPDVNLNIPQEIFLKQQLKNQLGSKINDFAIRAAEELKAHGWLDDGSLEGADLHGANLQNIDLSYANLKRAKINWANLRSADLTEANFENANLGGSDFRKPNENDPRSATLWYANLTNAILGSAKLDDVNLGGANLRGADLREASLNRTIFDENTILPDGQKWTPETDIGRFANPNHPIFWRTDSGEHG